MLLSPSAFVSFWRACTLNCGVLRPRKPKWRFIVSARLKWDFRRHHAARAGHSLTLTAREFDLLKYFVRRRGETIGRDELLDKVWGLRVYPLSRTVDNHISKLRQKIERLPAEPEYLITVHGSGYKFLG